MARKKRFKSRKQSTLNKIETKIYNILNALNLSVKTNASIDKYSVDFLIENKYIIEVYGDFWHCNPKKYSAEYFNRGKRKTAQEIWQRDNCRKTLFESLGYTFISLWESDINTNIKSIRNKIKRMIRDTGE